MLREWHKEFLEWAAARGYSKDTVRQRRFYVDRFIGFAQERGVYNPEEVSRELIEEYRQWLLRRKHHFFAKTLSISTLICHIACIKIFFTWLYRRHVLLCNPTAHLTYPKRVQRFPQYIPNQEELEKIILQPNLGLQYGLRDRAIMEVLYSSGIRKMELINLDIYDVDTNRGELRVRNGKGAKERIVPLGKIACAFIRKYLKQGKRGTVYPRRRFEAENSQPLFVSYKGKRLRPGGLSYLIRAHVSKVRPLNGQMVHMFRHAFATHMVQGGADISRVQNILGHTSIESTEIYTQVKPIDLKEIHRRCHPHGTLRTNKRVNYFQK